MGQADEAHIGPGLRPAGRQLGRQAAVVQAQALQVRPQGIPGAVKGSCSCQGVGVRIQVLGSAAGCSPGSGPAGTAPGHPRRFLQLSGPPG